MTNDDEPQLTGATASVEMQSLTPKFDPDQHQTYLDRLEKTLSDPKNRNIALTGRYGVGKSSVLEKLTDNHAADVRRVAISTLGPNDEGATLTNRIQKELVKQFLYSAKPKTLRYSRFVRTNPISNGGAALQASLAVAALWVILVMVGLLPPVIGTTSENPMVVRAIAWVGFGAVIAAILTVLRVVTHNRFFVTDLSAVGASIRLTEFNGTYFDEYLDQIVHYFDTEGPTIIVFEDLDRFNDPSIFESLRELNTLLNNTPKHRKKSTKPLRFVYAVRDSLFEQLGTDFKDYDDDAAAVENVRANRTKFFDIVIPIVPFISHRTSRELLTNLLTTFKITDLDRALIDTVAKHVVDMRLLTNICNEYLVFAERLLTPKKSAPGLTPNKLFPLVVYKNFHLKDFENITHRSSDLDHLYDLRRDLVRSTISMLENRKRSLATAIAHSRTRQNRAAELGDRLRAYVAAAIPTRPQQRGQRRWIYQVNGEDFSEDDTNTCEFWQATAASGEVTVSSINTGGSRQTGITIGDQMLAYLVPDGMNSERWAAPEEDGKADELAQINLDIAFLRGADFGDLAQRPEFTQQVPADASKGPAGTNGEDDVKPAAKASFADLIAATMKSDLARELVLAGYIDRNFTTYTTQFYGNFRGVDVATFMVQNVYPNKMEIDYTFTTADAIPNLLEEAGSDFTHTTAAFNIQVVDHLLRTKDDRVSHAVSHLVAGLNETPEQTAHDFLASYLTSGNHRNMLAARLASTPWRAVFTHLVEHESVPDDARPALLDAALITAKSPNHYDLNSEVGAYLIKNYDRMPAFTHPQNLAVRTLLGEFLEELDIRIPNLQPLNATFRKEIVELRRYELTGDNLRVALAVEGDISLENVSKVPAVYCFCLANLRTYLNLVEGDDKTEYVITTVETFSTVLNDGAADHEDAGNLTTPWTPEQVSGLAERSAPGAALPDLSAVASSTWPALAAAFRFHATLSNVDLYRTEHGIDDNLAALLRQAEVIDVTTKQDYSDPVKQRAAIALLKAETLSNPADRVGLVVSLGLNDYLPIDELPAEPGPLLALLLRHDLIEDGDTAFTHFQTAGRAALIPGIAESSKIESFLVPELVDGVVGDVLANDRAREKVGPIIVKSLGDYLPDDDSAALREVASFARDKQIQLDPGVVIRIAQAKAAGKELLLQLLDKANPCPSAAQILSIFKELGSDYAKISTPGEKFTLAKTAVHEHLLQTLKEAGICTTMARNKEQKIHVTVK